MCTFFPSFRQIKMQSWWQTYSSIFTHHPIKAISSIFQWSTIRHLFLSLSLSHFAFLFTFPSSPFHPALPEQTWSSQQYRSWTTPPSRIRRCPPRTTSQQAADSSTIPMTSLPISNLVPQQKRITTPSSTSPNSYGTPSLMLSSWLRPCVSDRLSTPFNLLPTHQPLSFPCIDEWSIGVNR